MNTPQTQGPVGGTDVLLGRRLAWLGAALWVIAMKVVVVVEFTPVAFTSESAFASVYLLAFGVPAAGLLLWIVRSGLRVAWKPGLIAALVLSGYLYAFGASGMLSHVLFTSPPWQTERVLYVHREDPARTIERQAKYTVGVRFRFVQQRSIPPFLAYVEPVEWPTIRDPGQVGGAWKPTPELLRIRPRVR